MKDCMRIAFLIGGFQSNGGIGRVVSILANGMAEANDKEIFAITYLQDERPLLYKLDERIVNIPLFNQHYSMKDAILKHHIISKLRNILLENEIDILIACGALFFPITISAVKGTKTKSICWEHSNANNKNDHSFQMLCRRIGARYADAMVVITKQDFELFKEKYNPKQMYQVYNPLDERINYCYNTEQDLKRIISVGRLIYQKNYPLLLNVAQKVLENKPDWIWDIYGDGPDREEIERLIIDLGLTNRVRLKGQVDDLYNRYCDYSFYVITSRYEGFGMALLEANQSGLPIVSFDVECGPREIITDGENGYLIEPLNESAMTQKVLELCEDRKRCLRITENIKKMDNPFKLSDILNKWDEVFEGILK